MTEANRHQPELDELDPDLTAVNVDITDDVHTPEEVSAELPTRRAQFSEAMGSVALMRSGVTMDNYKNEDQAEKVSASAYNQEVQPETIREKITAARLQKKLDKHARLVDSKLASKDLPKRLRVQRTKESELEALKRNNGKNDLRLRPRATKRAIKRVEKEARMQKLRGSEIGDDELAKRREDAVVYRSGTVRPFNRAAVPVATNRREKQARKLERYANKKMSGNDSGQRNSREQTEAPRELEHTLDTYFDPSNILSLKADLKHEADKHEIDAQVDAIRNTRTTNRTRASIEQDVLDSLLARHFGFSTMDEAREVVPHWLEMTVLDMLEMSNEQLENLANGTTAPEVVSVPEPGPTLRSGEQNPSRFSFEPDNEDTEDELAEAGRIAYNVNQRVSFRFSNQTRDKNLTDEEKEGIRFMLFTEALADELGADVKELDNPKVVNQSLKNKVLERIDKNEQERLERVEKMRAEEAAKTPEQRRTDAGNDALDKLRNTIND